PTGGGPRAGAPRLFEFKARRDQYTARKVWTQLVKPVGRGALKRPTLHLSRQDESHIFAGGHRDRRGHAPTDALRTPNLAVDRLLIEFFRREILDVNQKPRVTLREQARDHLSPPKPTLVDEPCRALTRLRRGYPMQNLV